MKTQAINNSAFHEIFKFFQIATRLRARAIFGGIIIYNFYCKSFKCTCTVRITIYSNSNAPPPPYFGILAAKQDRYFTLKWFKKRLYGYSQSFWTRRTRINEIKNSVYLCY